ncbi:MAG: hypothetical protein ABL998_22410 [Planctomycetota bacterium]
MSPPRLQNGWIFGPRADLAAFGGPILVASALIALAATRGFLHAPLAPWAFALLIVACDVAHVWSTSFRVYLDGEELRRHLALYVSVPLLSFAAGVALYSHSSALFWRALAYLAAFHFVRQQWGWIAYSRARAGEGERGKRFDALLVYALTVLPLVWWHARLPRAFAWFQEGDFVRLPAWCGTLALVLHWSIVGAWLARELTRLARGEPVNGAKAFLFTTTWCAWYGAIVLLDSDLAFTALNVLAHGVPYLVLVWRVERERRGATSGFLACLFRPAFAWLFVALLVALGYAEEWLWDRGVWHEHATLFPGPTFAPSGLGLGLLVPLLTVPQATHYVLDAWIWRRARHAELRSFLTPTLPSTP